MFGRNDVLLEYVRAKGFVWFVFVYAGVFVGGFALALSIAWYVVSLWLYGSAAPRPAWVESPILTVGLVYLVFVGLGIVAWPFWLLWFRLKGKRREA